MPSGETSPAPGAKKLDWVLGEEPAGLPFPAGQGRGMTSVGWLAEFHNRPLSDPSMEPAGLSFGDDLRADLYLPKSGGGKLPAVVYLHPYSYATGYSRYAKPFVVTLIQRGYAVLAFDQIGFGTRAEWARRFYERYPHWSLLGRMVADTKAAVDALAKHERIDAGRIYLAGYSLGGKVGLWSAAMGAEVAGVASVAGFTPLRTATAESGTEGIRHYSHLHGLAPRLGFYIGRETLLPVDYGDVLKAIAPRPVLVVAPIHDRYAVLDEIRKMTAGLGHVKLDTPDDFNRFPAATQRLLADWLDGIRDASGGPRSAKTR